MSRIGQLFGSLANTLLDLGLPRIRAWLRERVGDAADVAQVTTDGGFVHLDGVVVPLGARGLISLERATAAIGQKAIRAANLPQARLHAFKGVIRFGTTGGEPSFVADVVFKAETHADENAWIAGELTIEKASWTPAPGESEARAMRGAAKLFVTSSEWRLDDGFLESERARVRFSGRGPLDGSERGGSVEAAELVLDEAKVGPFLDAASAILGRTIAVPPGVPIDARITGELAFDLQSGGRGDLAIDAEGLEIRVRGTGAADGSSIDAVVDARARPAVAMRKAKLSPKLLPRDEDELVLALRVSGAATSPVVNGTITAKELAFRAGRPRFAPPAALVHDLVCELASEGDQALARATAKAGAGTLTLHVDVPVREPRRARAHVWIKDLDAPWVSALLGALDARIMLPRDAHATVDLALTLEEARGEASIVTPRSRVSFAPVIVTSPSREAILDGTRASGDVAFADALTLGLASLSVRPKAEGTITLDLGVSGPAAAPKIEGTIASSRFAVESPEIDIRDARGTAALDRTALVFRDLAFHGEDSQLTVDATIPFSKEVRANAVFRGEARAGLVAALAPLFPRPLAFADDIRVFGEIRLGGETRILADLGVETIGTSLVTHVVLARDGRLDGSTVRGDLGLADALRAFPVDGTVHPLPEGALRIDLALGGAGAGVHATGYAVSELVRLAVRKRNIEPVVLLDASAMLRIDARGVLWHKLEASTYGGNIASAGFFRADGALVTKVGLRDIAVEALPSAASDPTTLEPYARGRLSGAMRFDRRAGSQEIGGRGRARVEDGFFPVLAQSSAALGRYGLPPPNPRANAPATADIVFNARGAAFTNIDASVPGCHAKGNIVVGVDGAIDGSMVVTLDEQYLGSSAVLVLPHVLAETLTLPVRLGGNVRAPVVDADLAACFGRFMTNNRVSALARDAVQEVGVIFGARPASRAPAQPAEEPVASDDEDLASALEGAGVDWADIERRLDEHRTASRRIRIGP